MAVKLPERESDWTLRTFIKASVFSIIPKFFFVDAKHSHRLQQHLDMIEIQATVPQQEPQDHQQKTTTMDSTGRKLAALINTFLDSVCRPRAYSTTTLPPVNYFSVYLTIFSNHRKLPDRQFPFNLSKTEYELSLAVEKSLEETRQVQKDDDMLVKALEDIQTSKSKMGPESNLTKTLPVQEVDSSTNSNMETKPEPEILPESSTETCDKPETMNNQVLMTGSSKKRNRKGSSACKRLKKRELQNRRRSRCGKRSSLNLKLNTTVDFFDDSHTGNSSSHKYDRQRSWDSVNCSDDDTSWESLDENNGYRISWLGDLGSAEVDEGVDLKEPEVDDLILLGVVSAHISVCDDGEDDWDCWDEEDDGLPVVEEDDGVWAIFQNCGLNAGSLGCVSGSSKTVLKLDCRDWDVVDDGKSSDFVDGNVDSEIRAANERWLTGFSRDCDKLVPEKRESKQKKVCFADDSHLVTVHLLPFSTECRKGPWEEMYRDRQRFRKRIDDDLEPVLSRVLDSVHRDSIRKKIEEWSSKSEICA